MNLQSSHRNTFIFTLDVVTKAFPSLVGGRMIQWNMNKRGPVVVVAEQTFFLRPTYLRKTEILVRWNLGFLKLSRSSLCVLENAHWKSLHSNLSKVKGIITDRIGPTKWTQPTVRFAITFSVFESSAVIRKATTTGSRWSLYGEKLQNVQTEYTKWKSILRWAMNNKK